VNANTGSVMAGGIRDRETGRTWELAEHTVIMLAGGVAAEREDEELALVLGTPSECLKRQLHAIRLSNGIFTPPASSAPSVGAAFFLGGMLIDVVGCGRRR
jgi:hypothetical protein